MIIGILSDAHGNIYGLERALNLLKISKAEKIFFLGDALNYFGKSKEVLLLLNKMSIECIKGNHEVMLLENINIEPEEKKIYNLEFTQKILMKEDYQYIDSWKDFIEITVDNLNILMVHASPFNYFWEYIYPNSSCKGIENLPYDIIFIGHTHIPFIKQINGKLLINIGSVGLPRDDGRYISCSVFDTIQKKASILTDDFPSEHLLDLNPFSPEILTILNRRKKISD